MIKIKIFAILAIILFIIITGSIFLIPKEKSLNIPEEIINNQAPTVVIQQPKTLTPTPVELLYENQIQLQKHADYNFSQEQETIIQKYPWYTKLPIQTKTYFVYFNLKNNSFKALLYPDKFSDIPLEEQVYILKNEIVNTLKQIDIKTMDYDILWEVN